MSTLVFHHGALGDSVMLWPALRAVSPVTLIAPREKAMLAQHWIEGVRAIDGDAPDFSRLFSGSAAMEVSDEVRDLLAGADRVCSYISNGKDAWANNLRAIAPKAQLAFLSARPAEGDTASFVERQVHSLAGPDTHVDLAMPPLRHTPGGPVVVHPGSGGRDKRWPPERFASLMDHLRGIGRPAVLLLGEAEREWMEPALLDQWRRKHDVAEPDSLLELSRQISRASLYVGNDSGPTHLAAGLGVPTVALFGPTDPRVWRPWGPAVAVIGPREPSEMDWLPVEAVIEAISRWA
jgi:heptosyltransferase-3